MPAFFNVSDRSSPIGLPDGALLLGVHLRAERAIEVLGELVHVRERPQDAELAGAVESSGDAELHRLWPVLAAPGVRGADPEQLLGRVREARQTLLRLVPPHPFFVRQVGLFYPAVVGDVLALSVYSVQLEQKREHF